MTQMQGIVSILRSDNISKAASLRRTLSADMSSKRWLAGSGFPAMKKIASSEQIAVDSSSPSEEECDQVIGDNPRRIDIWTAIMSQKKEDDSGKLPPPYVHPLVKKSASSLSEKSLKVCTESLGSETGSDVFSEYPSSDAGDVEQEQQQPHAGEVEQEQEKKQPQEQINDEHKVVKPACLPTKKTQQPRSFPPPLPSLAAARVDGPSLHMHSRRVDGRLVLEAVSIPPQKYFEAQREDGRFLLTVINKPEELQPPSENEFVDFFEEEKDNDTDQEQDDDDDGYEIEIKNNNQGLILKDRPLNYTNMMLNVHKSITIKKMNERDNENPSWSRKLNTKLVSNYLSKLQVVEEEEAYSATPPPSAVIAKSLPPPPRATGRPPLPPPPAATSVNSYQYFWRAKPTVASVIDPMITQHRPPTKTKDLVLLRGNKADCLIPSLKGCKEPRRSLVMWEPFCIATS